MSHRDEEREGKKREEKKKPEEKGMKWSKEKRS
jgi:hypothetical protein